MRSTTRTRCVICCNMYLEIIIIILTKPDHRVFRLLKDRRNRFFITLHNNPILLIFWLFKQFLRVCMPFVVNYYFQWLIVMDGQTNNNNNYYYTHTHTCLRTAKSVFLFLPNHFCAQSYTHTWYHFIHFTYEPEVQNGL